MVLLFFLQLFLNSAALELDIPIAIEEITARPVLALNSTEWKDYRKEFKGRLTFESRARIFFVNVADIEAHNELYQNGSESYEMGINQFTDMTEAELNLLFSGIIMPEDIEAAMEIDEETYATNETMRHKRKAEKKPKPIVMALGVQKPKDYVDAKPAPQGLKGPKAPASLDLRKTGEVNAIRYQQSCGSCYTFSALAVLESAYYRKNRKSIDFSEQQALECWPGTPNRGCEGGWPPDVMEKIKKAGISTESAYPYKNRVTGGCKTNLPQLSYVKDVHKIPSDIESIKSALNNHGALSMCVNTVNQGFHQYKGGIYYHARPGCSHATNLVGYGSKGGKEYWIMRNSWDTKWGEKGYMRMDMKSPVSGFACHGATMK